MNIKIARWKTIGLLLIPVFICFGFYLGLGVALVSYDMDYLLSVAFAIFSLTFSIALPISQKRISIYSVMALFIGLLFLASSIIDFGFRPFELNMSISEKAKFYTILRLQQISSALDQIGKGLLSVLFGFGFRQITTKYLPKRNTQVYRIIYIAQISVGILLFTSGIYQVINGLYPSAYQLYRFSHIGQKAGIISFGLLIAWYMVAQPLIEKKRGMESLENKSA